MYLCCICVCIESFIVTRLVGINDPILTIGSRLVNFWTRILSLNINMIGSSFVSFWTRILSNTNNNGYKISI